MAAPPASASVMVRITMLRRDRTPRLGGVPACEDDFIKQISWLFAYVIRCAREVIAAAQGLEGCDLSEQLVAIGIDLLELRLVPVALRIQQIEVTEGAAVVAQLRQIPFTR